MAEVTVAELAKSVSVSVEHLLAQMKEAGLTHLKAEQVVSDEDKQTLLGFGKTDEIGELSFGNWTTRALVGQQPVDLSNRKHALAFSLMRLDCIALLKSHSPNGSAPQSVLAILSRRRKVDLGPAVFAF